jgi:hypothetical protein
VVQYAFDPTTGLPTGHSAREQGSSVQLQVSRSYDGFNRLSGVTNTASSLVSSYTYGLNDLGQRTSKQMNFGGQGIDSTWHYQYDSKGQLSNAWKTRNGQIMPGRHYGYAFDDIGNRLQTTRGNNTSDLVLNPKPVVTSVYTPNLFNQYDQRTIPAYAEISGTANPAAILSFHNEVTGDRIRAGRNDDWFHTHMPLSDNSALLSAISSA